MQKVEVVVAQFYLTEEEIRHQFFMFAPMDFDYELLITPIDQDSAALDLSVLRAHLINRYEAPHYSRGPTVFLNDTLFLKYAFPYYLRRLFLTLSEFEYVGIPVGVGEIHEFRRVCLGGGLPERYISTFLLGLNPAGTAAVEDSFKTNFQGISEDSKVINELSLVFGLWIVGQQPQFDAAKTGLISKKATAILTERLISAALLRSGMLVDIHGASYVRAFIRLVNRAVRIECCGGALRRSIVKIFALVRR